MKSRWDALAEGTVTMPVNDTLGFHAQATDDPKRQIVFTWTVAPEYCNSAGNVQGGVLAAFADSVLGATTAAHLPEDHYPSLAEMKISIVRPAPAGAELTATGRVIKAGRRVLFAEAEITNDDGELVAKASGTAVPTRA